MSASEEESDGSRRQAQSDGTRTTRRWNTLARPSRRVRIGNILFVGGHTPGPAYVGRLGAGFAVEQGYDGARQACLNCLADVKAVIGDLGKVKRVAKLLCMVNSAPDFGQQPLVANGATDLLSQLYGDAGAHARSAVGLAALPNGACIEIEMILEVED